MSTSTIPNNSQAASPRRERHLRRDISEISKDTPIELILQHHQIAFNLLLNMTHTEEKIMSAKWLDYLYHAAKKGELRIEHATELFNALTVMMDANTVCAPFVDMPPGKIKDIGHENVLGLVLKGLPQKKRQVDVRVHYETSTDKRETVAVQKIPAYGTHLCYVYEAGNADDDSQQKLHPDIENIADELVDELQDRSHYHDASERETAPSPPAAVMHRKQRRLSFEEEQFTADDRYVRFERNIEFPGAPHARHLQTQAILHGAPDTIPHMTNAHHDTVGTQVDMTGVTMRQPLPRYKQIITSKIYVDAGHGAAAATAATTPKTSRATNEAINRAKRGILDILNRLEADTTTETEMNQINVDASGNLLPNSPKSKV